MEKIKLPDMMNKYLNRIILGNALDTLREMPSNSVDLCITSPPYYSLRSYKTTPYVWDGDPDCMHQWDKPLKRISSRGTENALFVAQSQFCTLCNAWQGELGLEPTYQLYIKHLIQIFAEVKRVIKPTGAIWVNLADSYCGTGHKGEYLDPKYPQGRNGQSHAINNKQSGISSKSLIGIPERFALAMTDELHLIRRNTIIWHKPSCMPSSAKDRFTTDFEYLYFFTKSGKYYFDQQFEPHRTINLEYEMTKSSKWGSKKAATCKPNVEKYREDTHSYHPQGRNMRAVWSINCDFEYFYFFTKSGKYYFDQQFEPHTELKKWKRVSAFGWAAMLNDSFSKHHHGSEEIISNPQGRNMRTVWSINTEPSSEEHFAAFPRKLVETPIKACCPEFVCSKCGKARQRIYEVASRPNTNNNAPKAGQYWRRSDLDGDKRTISFQGYSDCGCSAPFNPGVVMDIFAGTGTTCYVAKALGRNYIGIEIQPKYVEIANRKLTDTLFAAVQEKPAMEQEEQQQLFSLDANERIQSKSKA